jgi:hypothetical protein
MSDHACDWPGCNGQCHTGSTCPCHPADLPDRAVQPEAPRPDDEPQTYDEAAERVHRAFCDPDHELVSYWDQAMADALRRNGYAIVRAASQERPTIDVKRLAEAMWGHQPADLRDTDTGSLHCGRECAEAIGGEYDRLSRLSSPEPVEPGE